MGASGTDLVKFIFGTGAFLALIYFFFTGGVGTAFSLSKIPGYAWAIILLMVFLFLMRKK